MKREVCCEKGAASWRKLIGKYPGENVKVVEGELTRTCICDSCVSEHDLKIGEKAFCVSVWTDGMSYRPWEGDFLFQEGATQQRPAREARVQGVEDSQGGCPVTDKPQAAVPQMQSERETAEATRAHVQEVQKRLAWFLGKLTERMIHHDDSKFQDPEFETFRIFTAKLKGSTYNSPEYKQFLVEMKPALDHHYAHGRHHPEHFANGIDGMTLVDLVEMFCDWWAASMRHADGSIRRSIEQNTERFGLSQQLAAILQNTAQAMPDFRGL